MQRFLFNIDRISAWSGKTVSWVILLSTFLISYDILMRYLSKPFLDFIRPIWFTYDYSYDMSYYLYAVLFMIGGAYTLSRAQSSPSSRSTHSGRRRRGPSANAPSRPPPRRRSTRSRP